MVDGGYLRGSDVVKALALGARCVGVGRLECLGLAAGAEAGLERALELLEDEIRICLGLLGVDAVAKLDASYLHRPAPVVSIPGALSAFHPLLALEEERY
jgi:glycolate oxidase